MLLKSSLLGALLDGQRPIWLLLLSAIIYWQWQSYRQLSHFKGPFWAHFTNLWIYQKVSGDLARIAPNQLVTGDIDMLHRMSAARSNYTRLSIYAGNTLMPETHNTFSMVDEPAHTKRRAVIAAGYTGNETEELESKVNQQIAQFLNLIRTKYISTDTDVRPIDLARKCGYFTLDTITNLSFSSPWGFLVQDKDLGNWFALVGWQFKIVTTMQSIPWLLNIVTTPWAARLMAKFQDPSRGAAASVATTTRNVQVRFATKNPGEKMDMMGSFIRHGVTETEAASEAILAVYTPLSSRRLHDSDAQSKTLPYLQAVIREGARIVPPTAGTFAKVAPKGGDTVNGRSIPGGTQICISILAVLREKQVFGKDVEMFRPERWITDAERLKGMEKNLNMIWWYGRYQCLGKDLAWMELNKLYFELLKNFDFQIINPSHPWKSENYGVRLQKNMFIKATLRR
ncbi:Cytochrome P450 monooxygenase [Lachnellula subtilissima]|uniref:Cytochrome P450 monooxygenase n=1 Tax=Lachnellula subtilissima TaxID=602034 RepID=A0A8H8RNU6_9HELO|nr:Cytochrome P450 monooxygenase [Lachnellula subtilissima]